MSRPDEERVADILDAASELAEVTAVGREQFPTSALHYHRTDPGQVWHIATRSVPALADDLRP